MLNMMFVLLLAVVASSVSPARAEDLQAFSYPDTPTAQQRWRPQFGSKPVRVEKLADGTTCLALDAEYAKPMDRACWDWTAPLDLSNVSRVAFDVSATNPSAVRMVGLYFGTSTGWYPTYWGGATESWTTKTFSLARFGVEDKPDGWDKVTTLRFSPWGTGAGKVTFRLRNFRTVPKDPGENFLKNGSFEIPGVGVPYGWGSGHWGVGDLPWATDMDLWRRHWHLDTTVAKHGSTSLYIENTPELPLLKAVTVWLSPPWEAQRQSVEKYTLSAWLKSDQEKLPVAVGPKVIEVGQEWVQAVAKEVPFPAGMAVTIAPKAPGKLWIDAVQLQTCEEATAEFHPCFDDEGLIAREKLVDWSSPRRTREVAAGRHITGPVKPAKVSIDAQGRFLLDGKPYIQHSLGLEYVSNPDILNFVAKSGFKDVCIQIRENVTTDQLKGIFDRCAEVGLRVIPWLDGRIPRERYADHLRALKDHPALLCWYVMDEPSGELFAEAEARLKLAKELDPTHPAFINYLSNKLEGHAGDIYSTDVYPIPHSTPMEAINAVNTMQAAAEKEHKPVWMWLQSTGYAYSMDREPTPRELSCMVYGSLIAGARGIYYFAQIPRTKECFDEMRTLCVEVDALTPALGSLDPVPEIRCDQSNILCQAYLHQGEAWVLAVNTSDTRREARFTLSRATRNAEVVFEGRRIAAQGDSWSDNFGPYERHAYRCR
ncbi:MAG: hypothetical protein COZ56_16605 [Armatimonadetes bacterium CG_4_8_14_3_um_filter_58_9]|nr:MAG: hypothetical protein COZ56_16605 [Armatimonadetes bacterium CG_4_8_14_3_um_filter_58_9]